MPGQTLHEQWPDEDERGPGWMTPEPTLLPDGNPKYPAVEVQLSGEDGNAFAILGRVRHALRKAGIPEDEVFDFTKEATGRDHENLLVTVAQWVSVS